MFHRSCATLLLLFALTLPGCGGGGGGGGASAPARSSSAPGGTPAGVTAAQKTGSTATTDTVAQVVQQVTAAEEALAAGNDAMGGGFMGRMNAPQAFTSMGPAVFEIQAPSQDTPAGSHRVTVYDAALVAGTNFTDSDADGRVSNQAEKDSITARRVMERAVQFSMDFAAGAMTAAETLRVYGASTVDRFSTRTYTNTLGFAGTPAPGMRPNSVETTGRATAWSGAAAETASQAVAQGGSPDATTADHASRYHSKWDFANRTSLTEFAGTSKMADGKWKLSLGRNTGSLTRTQDGATATHQGTARAWQRASAFNLDTEVTAGPGGFAFTPTGGDTQVADLAVNLTSTMGGHQRVLQGTIRDEVKGLTFTFTVQDGLLTGTILADTPNGPVQVATVTLDQHGNGQIVFTDGTVVQIRHFRPQAA